MKKDDETPLADRIAASVEQLHAAATKLNTASDVLGASVSAVDAALQKMNLGVSARAVGQPYGGGDESETFEVCLSYDKVGSKWALAIETWTSDDRTGESVRHDQWVFSDAPRRHRVDAIKALPKLLEMLTTNAHQTAQGIERATADAEQIAATITAATKKLAGRK